MLNCNVTMRITIMFFTLKYVSFKNHFFVNFLEVFASALTDYLFCMAFNSFHLCLYVNHDDDEEEEAEEGLDIASDDKDGGEGMWRGKHG